MDTVAHQRLLNTVLGLTMVLFGLCFFMGAGYVYLHPPEPIGEARLIEGDIRTCQNTLIQLGHEVHRQGNELRVERVSSTFDNAERMLADASLGISACSLPIVRFCMGAGCTLRGVSFALSTQVSATNSRK